MEKLTYHAMGLVISQFKQFPYDEIHRMAFLIAIQASRKKPNIFVTFVFLVKKGVNCFCQATVLKSFRGV